MSARPPDLRHPPAPATANAPLFRQQAVEAQAPSTVGSIMLLPGSGSGWVAWAALLVAAGLVLLMAFGSYTRRATVVGVVQPSEGLIRVSAQQSGVVIERRAVEGQNVTQGEVLFVLSGDRLGPDARNVQSDVAAHIQSRRQSLEGDRRRGELAEQQEAEQLRRRVASLRSEQDQLARQTQDQTTRLALAADALKRYEGLFKQDFISRDELQPRQADVVEQRSRLQGLGRDALALQRELANTERDLANLATRFASQRAEIDRAVLATRQEFTEVEARRRIVVTAPATGRLTLLQVDMGQTVEPLRPLAHVVPQGARMVARLYAPSRTAGFTRQGAEVLVRYDAFPYQKFGQHRARVVSISTVAVAPAEINNLGPSAGAEAAGDALFAITAELPAQSVGVGEQARALQSGMRLEADLLQEKRRLFEWMLEPLFSATARMDSP